MFLKYSSIINLERHHGVVKVTPLESKDLVLNPEKAESHVRQPKKVTEMEHPRGHLLSVAGNQT